MNALPRIALTAMALLLAFGAVAQRHELKKNISEKYTVAASDKLVLLNKFGDITINTWTRNEITVDVQIEAWGKNDKDAQEMLSKVNVAYGKSGSEIKFETSINSSNISNNDKSGFKINYSVNMPMGNPLSIENKFGAVNIADFGGELYLEVGYGHLQAGILKGNSQIVLKYSKGSIEGVNTGNLDFKYSGNVSIGKVGKVTLNDRYGGVNIEEAEEIEADIAYSGLKVGKLSKSLDLTSKYAGCSIKNIAAGFSSVEVDNAYGSVNLGFDAGASFQFDVETKFGGFKSELSNVDMQKQIEQNTSSEYEGKRGSGQGRVTVRSSFGSVKFMQ